MIEAWRRGIEQMQADCEAHDVPGPLLKHEADGLWLEFKNHGNIRGLTEIPAQISGDASEKTSGVILHTTQKTAQKILTILQSNPSASQREIAEILGDITASGVKYHLNKLKSSGHIRRVGPDKGGFWQIIDDDEVS